MYELLVVVRISVILAVVAVHVDGNVGATHLRQGAVSAAEYAEVRIVVVRIRELPFFCHE